MDVQAERIADLHVLDVEGRSVPTRDLWANETAIFGFVRHFG